MYTQVPIAPRRPHPDGRRLFRYPIEPYPKVLVMCDTLHVPPGCSKLPEHAQFGGRTLSWETLAAPAAVLLVMPDGWMPQFPLVAFTGARHGFLEDGDRDRLWRRFAVPVFEQLLDDEGGIFASECEAHAGLHVAAALHYTLIGNEAFINGRPTGIAVQEVAGLCGCGEVGPRLQNPSPISLTYERSDCGLNPSCRVGSQAPSYL